MLHVPVERFAHDLSGEARWVTLATLNIPPDELPRKGDFLWLAHGAGTVKQVVRHYDSRGFLYAAEILLEDSDLAANGETH